MTGCERMMTAILLRGVPDKVPIWELIINRPVIKALCPDLLSDEKGEISRDGEAIRSVQTLASRLHELLSVAKTNIDANQMSSSKLPEAT